MKIRSISFTSLAKIIPILCCAISIQAFAGSSSYKEYSSSCRSCVEIEKLLSIYDSQQSGRDQLDTALRIAKVIKHTSVKGNGIENQRREIYYAIKASIQILDDDFDSESVVGLMDLRDQSPEQFDYVFWRFPFADQKEITHRMSGIKSNTRPKASIPQAKALAD
jgi:hypothetical protein